MRKIIYYNGNAITGVALAAQLGPRPFAMMLGLGEAE